MYKLSKILSLGLHMLIEECAPIWYLNFGCRRCEHCAEITLCGHHLRPSLSPPPQKPPKKFCFFVTRESWAGHTTKTHSTKTTAQENRTHVTIVMCDMFFFARLIVDQSHTRAAERCSAPGSTCEVRMPERVACQSGLAWRVVLVV